MLFRLLNLAAAVPAFRTAIFETVAVFASAALMATLPHLFMRDKGRDTRTLLSTFILMIGVMGAAPFVAQIDFTPDPVQAHGDTQGRISTPVDRAGPPPQNTVDPQKRPDIEVRAAAAAPAEEPEVEGKTIPEVEGERRYFADGVGAWGPGDDASVEEDTGPVRRVATVGAVSAGAQADAAFSAARRAQAAGRPGEALSRYRAAKVDYRAAGDPVGEANSWQGEGESLRALGEDAAAAAAHGEALGRYATLGVDIGRANALLGLGFASQRRDPAMAASRFRDAAALYDAAGLADWAARARRAWAALPRAARLAAPLD